jgi:voltage-gated potassium channel
MTPRHKHHLHRRLNELYFGDSRRAVRFRLAWIVVDIVIIGFFIAAPIIRNEPIFLITDYIIAAIVAADLGARAFAWHDLRTFLRRPNAWIDLFVLLTLLFPSWAFNLGFLRVLRLWTLFNSDVFWRTLAHRYDNTRVEDVTRALATLITFVFVMTGFVYTSFARVPGSNIVSYVDALYFTVTTLTTTGFGDITLPGTWGRILAIVIMTIGITLFVRLGQAIIRPYKVRFRCPTCGLGTHDVDAVHCKACGTLLNIPNDED